MTGSFKLMLRLFLRAVFSCIKDLSVYSATGLSSSLWDLFGWTHQQRQPPSSQPVSHHPNSRHTGHHLLDCGCSCVHLPAGLAEPGLQHCGWSHFYLHAGHQLHAVCASGEKKTAQRTWCKPLEKKMPLLFLRKRTTKNCCHYLVFGDGTEIESRIQRCVCGGMFFGQRCHLITCFVWEPAFIKENQSVMQGL